MQLACGATRDFVHLRLSLVTIALVTRSLDSCLFPVREHCLPDQPWLFTMFLLPSPLSRSGEVFESCIVVEIDFEGVSFTPITSLAQECTSST